MDPNKWTDQTIKIFQESEQLAFHHKHSSIYPIHFLKSIYDQPSNLLHKTFQEIGGDTTKLTKSLSHLLSSLPTQNPAPVTLSLHQTSQNIIRNAIEKQNKNGDDYLALDTLLLALLEDNEISKTISSCGVNIKEIQKKIVEMRKGKKINSKSGDEEYDLLSKYGIDLTLQAENNKIDPVIGRDDEIKRVIKILSRRTKNNPLLTGEPGVGKTAIVEGLAQRIVKGDVPSNLQCKLVSLDMASLVAGTTYRGQFEERLKGILTEIKESRKPIILFIDEIHTVLGAGSKIGRAHV